MNQQGLTLIVVTHDPQIGERARRRIRLSDAIASDENLMPAPPPAVERPSAANHLSFGAGIGVASVIL